MNPIVEQGYNDYWNDVLLTECPHKENEGLRIAWRKGWWDAYWEDFTPDRDELLDKAQ